MSANTPVRQIRKERPSRKEEQIERIMLSLPPKQREMLCLYMGALKISQPSGLLDVVHEEPRSEEDEEKAIDALGAILKICNLPST